MKRSCGSCKACCWAPEVDELKSTGEWCPNCNVGQALGCSVYAERPSQCAEFLCLYIRQPRIVPGYLSPRRANIMVTATDNRSLRVWELKPGAASRPKVARWISECRRLKLSVVVVDPSKRVVVLDV